MKFKKFFTKLDHAINWFKKDGKKDLATFKKEAAKKSMPEPLVQSKVTNQMKDIIEHYLPDGPMKLFMMMRLDGWSTLALARKFEVDERVIIKFENGGKKIIKKRIAQTGGEYCVRDKSHDNPKTRLIYPSSSLVN